MKRLIAAVLAVFLAAGAAEATCGNVTTVTSTTDVYIKMSSGREFSVAFDQDVSGTEAVATISLEWCMDKTGDNACSDLDIVDSDSDGFGDTNILSGTSTLTQGAYTWGFPYLRIQVGTAPTTGTPKFSVCWRD